MEDQSGKDNFFRSNSTGDTIEESHDAQCAHKEHSQLSASLNALTTHFAHVQFRLRQIIDAPVEDKESLLIDLEEFTFQGLPDFQNATLENTEEQVKDHLIQELKKQISELQTSIKQYNSDYENKFKEESINPSNTTYERNKPKKEFKIRNSFMKRLSSIIHVVDLHYPEGKDKIRRESLRLKLNLNHFGDMRAQLELIISELVNFMESDNPTDSDYVSDSESSTMCNDKLLCIIRQKLAPAIQALMQHGLMSENKSISVHSGITAILGCVPRISSKNINLHAWELVLKYYKMKNGEQFNSTPAMKLSQSFNIDVGGVHSNSCTHKLLVTIGSIISSHSQFKRSNNAQFKAFICAALNSRMLSIWIQLIYRSKVLIEMYYEPWSYAVQTHFGDAVMSMEKLSHFHFNLPVNTAIRQLQEIKDAF